MVLRGFGYSDNMVGKSGSAESYWMDSTAATSYAGLTEDIDVDVAVIGGGIAGLCTAWELARTGAAVALLEADRIAAGVTGYTTAKLTAQHGLVYAHLRSKLDEQAARWYAASQLDAIEHVAATVADLGIDCDLERRPAYTYLPEEKRGTIEAEVQSARLAGLPASLVTGSGLPYPIGVAIRVERQAQFHPRRYLLALAADLVGRGGRIFERTRVVDLNEGKPCRLTTEGGTTVTARDVVVATHYPIFDRAGLFTRLVPHRELVVAAVIDADDDPDGMYVTPEENTRSVRTAPYDDGHRPDPLHRPPPPGRLARLRRDRLQRLGHDQRRPGRSPADHPHQRHGPAALAQAVRPPSSAPPGRGGAPGQGRGHRRQAFRRGPAATAHPRRAPRAARARRRGRDPDRRTALRGLPRRLR